MRKEEREKRREGRIEGRRKERGREGGGIRVPLFLKKELQKWLRPLCPHQRDLQKGVNQKR